MVYRGQVQHGVVVFDGGKPLDEGTIVQVEPVAAGPRKLRRGSMAAILSHAGTWAGPDEEIDSLLDELRRMKQEELRQQQRNLNSQP